ncbi:MAG: tape measure protein [Cyanobacteria bacterium J06638_20]
MANFRITVTVDSRPATTGVRRTKRELNDLERTANRLNRALVATFAGISTVAAVRGVFNLLDSYNQLENRLRVVTTSQGNLNAVFDELFAVSQRSRSSLAGTVELYSRLAISSRELGVNQQELLQFTESVNKAIIVSGASFREANQGLIQLSQGIASGTLRGDELRSVLEQLPIVADVIAQELGVTRGELRKLGEQGLITAGDIITAFQNAEEQIEQQFAKTIPTLSQAFGLLADQVRFTVGRLDEAVGATEVLVRAILFLRDNIQGLLGVLVAIIPALAVRLAGAALLAAGNVGLLTRAIGILNVVLSANPIVALATALSFVVGLLIQFGDQVNLFSIQLDDGSRAFVNLADVARATIGFVIDAFQTLLSVGQAVLQGLVDLFASAFGGLNTDANVVLSAISNSIKNFVNGYIGFFVFFVSTVIDLLNNLPAAADTVGRAIANALVMAIQSAINLIIRTINGLTGIVNRVSNAVGGGDLIPDIPNADLSRLKLQYSDAGLELGNAVRENFDTAFGTDFVGDAAAGINERAEQIARDRVLRAEQLAAGDIDASGGGAPERPGGSGGSGTNFAEILAGLQQENDLLRVNGIERQKLNAILDAEDKLKRNLTQTEASLISQVIEQNAVLTEQADILDGLRGPQEQLDTRLTALNQLFQEGRVSLMEYQQELNNLRVLGTGGDNSFLGGISNGLARVAQQANEFGAQVSDFVVGAFDKASDAVVEFAKTGKLSIRDFFGDLAAQLLKIATDQLFAQLVSGLFGGFGGFGGLGSLGTLGLPGFATGGSFEVGGDGRTDNTLVAFRATRGEQVNVSTPQQQRRQGEGMVMQPTIVQAPAPNVVVQITPRDIVEALSGSEGDEFIVQGLERNRKSASSVLQGG